MNMVHYRQVYLILSCYILFVARDTQNSNGAYSLMGMGVKCACAQMSVNFFHPAVYVALAAGAELSVIN